MYGGADFRSSGRLNRGGGGHRGIGRRRLSGSRHAGRRHFLASSRAAIRLAEQVVRMLSLARRVTGFGRLRKHLGAGAAAHGLVLGRLALGLLH